LRKIFRNLRKIKDELLMWQPDVVIPVDYPGFNMRIAKFASLKGMRVFYFISPKVWAWKQRRVYDLRKYTEKLFVILPFEVSWFKKFGIEVEYSGNPLVDGVKRFLRDFEGGDVWKEAHGLDDRPVVALLAGSRIKEIQGMLPAMAHVASGHPEFQFVVAGAPSIDPGFYEPYLGGANLKIVHGETYALLATATAGLITSGTATLETALFGVPQVVMYRTSSLAYSIAKHLVKIKHISLVNLILDRGLVLEVIQKSLYSQTESELSRILNDARYREQMIQGYEELGSLIGEEGVSERIAIRMVELLKEEKE
ncbi:MAG: lipid-A-disaccharide synthase, partial [Bacteroides sp.]|nr:lipid-A-disaccharide synthase [Bacteroides sp.]